MDQIPTKFSILYVDDEQKPRQYFTKILQDNYNIITSSNIIDAQKIINSNDKIAAVISDQRMPGGNGVKLLKFLKTNYPNIIRIFTTAYRDFHDAKNAVNQAEIFRFIPKPWHIDSLKGEIAQAIDLFILKYNCDHLVAKKYQYQNKLAKLSRIRCLLVISKIFNHLNLTENSIISLIHQYLTDPQFDQYDQQLGVINQDDEEQFLNQLLENLYDLIPLNTKQLNQTLSQNQLSDLMLQYNISNKDNQNHNLNWKINNHNLIKILQNINKINLITNNQNPLSVHQNKNNLYITIKKPDNLKFKDLNILNLNNSNEQFTTLTSHVTTLFLLVSHHGGQVTLPNNYSDNFEIKLPLNNQKPTATPNIDLNLIKNLLINLV